MSILEWDGSLSIGHSLIDEQHQTLIGIINKLHTARVTQNEQKKIRLIIMELYKYTAYHFGAEESLMIDIPFKMKFEHKLEHQKFIDTLDEITGKANSGDVDIGTETFNWLVGWLLEHISVTDKGLVAYLPKG